MDDGLNSKINYKILEEDSVPVKKDGRHHATFIINPTTGDLRINFSKPNLTDTLGWHAVLIKVHHLPTLTRICSPFVCMIYSI